MLLYDKGRLLVGVKLIHLALVAVLSFFLFIAMVMYREHYHGYSNLRRIENGWKAEWSGAWHPWAEIETFTAFKRDIEVEWRWLGSGDKFVAPTLNWQINALNAKKLAEEFKDK
jgi:hypothetical protein